LRILVLTHKSPVPPNDGGSKAVVNLVNGLAIKGIELTILTMSTLKHPYLLADRSFFLHPSMKIHSVEVPAKMTLVGLIVNILFSRIPYTATRFISKKFDFRLKQLLQENDFDIVQLECLYTAPYIETIREKSNAQICYRAHNVEYIIWERLKRETNNIFKKLYLSLLVNRIKRFEKSIINSYDSLITLSKIDEAFFTKQNNTKPSITIPVGFEITGNMPETKFSNQMFFIGSLDWIPNRTGLKWFISEILPKLRDAYPNFCFHVAGRNAPKEWVAFFAANNVSFHGEVENSKDFMKKFPVMIVPIFSGSGIRIKILEAMLLGCLVISTSVGAEGLNLVHKRHLIIANTPEEFVDAIYFLNHNYQVYNEITKNAYRYACENFDNENLTERCLNFYNKQLN